MPFKNLGLHGSLVKATREMRYTEPTPVQAMWRAYVASVMFNLGTASALQERLTEDLDLFNACRFSDGVPGRSTFTRFFERLENHPELPEPVSRLAPQVGSAPDEG